MLEIRKGTLYEYRRYCAPSASKLAQEKVTHAALCGGGILLACAGGTVLGSLCYTPKGPRLLVVDVLTVPQARGRGVCTALISFLLEHSPLDVLLTVEERDPSSRQLGQIAQKLGFTLLPKTIVRRSGAQKQFAAWEQFMRERGEAYCARFVRQGFRCVSMREAGVELLSQLYDSGSSEFANTLDVQRYFTDPYLGLDRSMSFVASKAGKVAAYTIVTKADKDTRIFDQSAEAACYQGSGLIFLPFAASLAAFQAQGCQRAIYTMYESNTRAQSFFSKLTHKLMGEEQHFINWVYEGCGLRVEGNEGNVRNEE